MAVYDDWEDAIGCHIQGEEIRKDVHDWPSTGQKHVTLRLGELARFDLAERNQLGWRNVERLRAAKQQRDITHVEVHYTCIDEILIEVLVELLTCDQRDWQSFTISGVNDVGDHYGPAVSLEDFAPLLIALGKVKALNVYSCTRNRGHGLEAIMKGIPSMHQLVELRLHGWQIDQVSANALIKGIQKQDSETLNLLSVRSGCFLDNSAFKTFVDGLSSMGHLKILNLSYCNLGDYEITYFINAMQEHSTLECLHIGGNDCMSLESVDAVSSWIRRSNTLRDLNLRALWICFTGGLVQRLVDLSNLFLALKDNSSLIKLTLSENYLTCDDVERLEVALQSNDTLTSLDISNNHFEEKGAQQILRIVRRNSMLEQVRFESQFCRFNCAEGIKLQTQFNWVNRRLRQLRSLPLSAWPYALAHLGSVFDEKYHDRNTIVDLFFHILRSPTGEYGLPLAVQVAMVTSWKLQI